MTTLSSATCQITRLGVFFQVRRHNFKFANKMVTKNVIVFALASQIQKIIGLRIVRQFQIKSVSSTVAHCQLPNQIIPEQRWLQSTIVKNEKNAKGLRMIEVEVNDAVSSQYLNPGQYVKLKRENAIPSFFALASPPDNRKILSFLIKERPSNNFIVESKEGDNIDVSMPHGQGFQIKEHFQKHRNCFPVNRILLMACGSGIAPIAAAIESDQLGLCNISQRNSSREVLLYIGARTPLHLPFADRYASWEAKGVNVSQL